MIRERLFIQDILPNGKHVKYISKGAATAVNDKSTDLVYLQKVTFFAASHDKSICDRIG